VARNRIIPIVQKYYLHYDQKTGKILSISNEKTEKDEHSLEVSFEEYADFIHEVKKAQDHIIGYAKDNEGKNKLVAIPSADQHYGFRNNVFEWITEPPNKTTELIVTWNGSTNEWVFQLSDLAKKRVSKGMVTTTVFFVMLENDFDFLIRSMLIDVSDLIENSQIHIPFISNIEHQIKKISISSKIYFQSYGLIINEQD
jgi:hypothetical protein